MCTSLVLALLSVHCIRSVHSQAPVSVASQLTELQIGKLLNAHNVIRSEVSPHAADMLKMSWNDALGAVAQEHANKCTWHYNDERTMSARNLGLQYAYVGENVFISAAELDMALQRAMASWVGEEVNYNRTTNQCKPNQLCSHYKQIVWSTTQEVGCGVSQCQSVQGLPTWQHTSTVLVCNYAIGGLMPANAVPYARGERCSLCPPSAPNCENGALCVSGIPATAPPKTQALPTEPPVTQVVTKVPATRIATPRIPTASAVGAAPTASPSNVPADPRPNARVPVDPNPAAPAGQSGIPAVPNAVFMLEFERRFQKLERQVNALETRNAELKQALEAGGGTSSGPDPSKGNRHSRVSAHLETPSSGVMTLSPGSVISRYDTQTNDTKLFGGFKLLPAGSLVVPEAGNYYVYAQITSMQWGPASIRITKNTEVIASASSSYGFQESAYSGKFTTLKKGDKIMLQLGKGSKLYRSGPGITFFGAFQL